MPIGNAMLVAVVYANHPIKTIETCLATFESLVDKVLVINNTIGLGDVDTASLEASHPKVKVCGLQRWEDQIAYKNEGLAVDGGIGVINNWDWIFQIYANETVEGPDRLLDIEAAKLAIKQQEVAKNLDAREFVNIKVRKLFANATVETFEPRLLRYYGGIYYSSSRQLLYPSVPPYSGIPFFQGSHLDVSKVWIDQHHETETL